jgi:hypothetical protein
LQCVLHRILRRPLVLLFGDLRGMCQSRLWAVAQPLRNDVNGEPLAQLRFLACTPVPEPAGPWLGGSCVFGYPATRLYNRSASMSGPRCFS